MSSAFSWQDSQCCQLKKKTEIRGALYISVDFHWKDISDASSVTEARYSFQAVFMI